MIETIENAFKRRAALIGMLCAGLGMMLETGIMQRSLVVFGFGLVALTVTDLLTQRK